MPYSDEIEQLAKLESFDVKAYMADDNFPEHVCGFLLSLAVAYNDLRDLTLAKVLMVELGSPDVEKLTTELGQFNGMANSIIRFQAGTLNELLSLIENNTDAIEHKSFQSLIEGLSSEAKESWGELVLAANDRRTTKQLGKTLILIRNKVAFHYDEKIISQGYRNCFESGTNGRVPLISRGTSMQGTRFYFADAATQDYINSMNGENTSLDVLSANTEILTQVNQALLQLVTRFPPLRGCAWREFE